MKRQANRMNMGRRRFLKTAAVLGLSPSRRTSETVNTIGDRPKVKPRFDRCILLGMDGLDPQIVAALIRENKLPHFAKLAREGTLGPLQTSNPAMSPVAWSNIATGAGPGHHGIFDFLHRDPENYLPYLSVRRSINGLFGTRYEKARSADGFWRYTSDAGIPTTVLRWPVTFPPEKVNGRFLSGLGVPDLLGTEGQYAFYTTEPMSPDDPSPHNVVPVQWTPAEIGVVRTVLKGPTIGRGSTSEVHLAVQRKTPEVSVLRVGDGPLVEARRGHWTPWIKVTFKAGVTRVHGVVKLLLLEAEPQLRLLVSPIHLDSAHPAFAISYPADYACSLDDQIGTFHTLGMPELVHPLSHRRYGFEEFLAQVETVRAERQAMYHAELASFDKGVLAFVFDHTDRIQHAFWATRDPTHPMYDPKEAASYANVIQDMYREMDTCLGQAIEQADAKTLLFAVSDHGFGSFRRQVHLNRWLVDNGFMRLKGPQEAEGPGLFQDVDWHRTRAYAMGFSSIYLNLAGREGGGIIKRDEPLQELLSDIVSKLQALVDPDSGRRMIHKVYLGRQIYANGPQVGKAPDLVVGFEPGYRASWQTALGGAPTKLVEDNKSKWSGDHIFDPDLMPGTVVSNVRLKGQSFQGIDIATTILAGLGLAKPPHMTGRSLLDKASGSTND